MRLTPEFGAIANLYASAMRRAIPLTVALVLFIAACSDDTDPESSPTTESSASDATEQDEVESTEVDAEDPWCAVARDLNEALALDAAADGTASGLETAFTELAAAIDTAEASAPEEIQEQVVALGDGIDSFIDVLAEADWDGTAITEELGAELSEPIDEALEDIESFNEDRCGLVSEAGCASDQQTLEVAIEAFIASEGQPPVDEAELVDAGFLRDEFGSFDVVDGEIVAVPGGGCE